MASITRFCASALSAALLLSACSGPVGEHGFSFNDADLRPGFDRVNVRLDQVLRFSPQAMEALENGVPLVVRFSMELRAADTLALIADGSNAWEIRYLPLSQRYQLTGPDDDVETFPRLRHVLGALSSKSFTLETGHLHRGEYTFRGRVMLDHSSLPIPMQLPAALSSDWRHDSNWHQWQFEISA